jgi:hypothetical protein
MRYLCPVHGCQPVLQMSPDLMENPGEGIHISYCVDEIILGCYRVSKEFAKQHELQEGSFDLPDEHPDWVHLTTIICKKCFEEKLSANSAHQ